jgi:hypothetical protein
MCPIIPEQAPDFGEGIYLAEIKQATLGTSKTSGFERFEIVWKAVGFPGDAGDLVTDYISFSKKAAGITQAKLGVFGFDVGEDVQSRDLLGKRAWLLCGFEEWEGRDGRKGKSLKVSMDFDNGCRAGYWPEDGLPEHLEHLVVKPPKAGAAPTQQEIDETPF